MGLELLHKIDPFELHSVHLINVRQVGMRDLDLWVAPVEEHASLGEGLLRPVLEGVVHG